jgi:asparaginyl-tRNA synthetase
MIEPEMAFADLFQAMTNAEEFVKYVIKYTLGSCVEDMKFFEKFMDKELMTRLLKVVDEPFVRLPYRDAVVLLQDEIAKDPSKWKYPEMKFGTDFSTGRTRPFPSLAFYTVFFPILSRAFTLTTPPSVIYP